jgi:hypothetical protein
MGDNLIPVARPESHCNGDTTSTPPNGFVQSIALSWVLYDNIELVFSETAVKQVRFLS